MEGAQGSGRCQAKAHGAAEHTGEAGNGCAPARRGVGVSLSFPAVISRRQYESTTACLVFRPHVQNIAPRRAPRTARTGRGFERARGGGANARARGAARARAPRWPRWPLRRCALVCGESECGLNVCGVWCRDGVRVRDHARGSVPLVRGAAVYFILYAIPYGRIGIRYTALLYYMSYCRPRVGRRALRTAQRTGGRGNTYLN